VPLIFQTWDLSVIHPAVALPMSAVDGMLYPDAKSFKFKRMGAPLTTLDDLLPACAPFASCRLSDFSFLRTFFTPDTKLRDTSRRTTKWELFIPLVLAIGVLLITYFPALTTTLPRWFAR
jgi:hypothetical protein